MARADTHDPYKDQGPACNPAGMSHDTAIAFYVVVLWGSLLGITAPDRSSHWVCVRSKQLAGVAFVALVVEGFRY